MNKGFEDLFFVGDLCVFLVVLSSFKICCYVLGVVVLDEFWGWGGYFLGERVEVSFK